VSRRVSLAAGAGVIDLPVTLSGFGVGIVVGLTGIGGGALMTPVLVLIFGVAPQTAVGTDLLFACVTKIFGVIIHGRRATVDWVVVGRLSAGSLVAALLTVLSLGYSGTGMSGSGAILHALGFALLLTATGLVFRGRLHKFGKRLRTDAAAAFKRTQPGLTVLAGALVGCLVALTSVGAGALGTVALLYLYPYRLTAAKLVGTDLAHAIPLTLVAGLGHLALGNIDFQLLGNLLLGSIPGIMLGSLLSTRAPEALVRNAIAGMLFLVAGKLLL
jgi:uncharacterized membrane protein YfcA